MNKNGYAIKEILILTIILGVLFTIAITKVSFAYQEADKTGELEAMKNNSLQIAAETYVNNHKDKFQEEETFFYGSELVSNNYLLDIEEEGYNAVKFKVTHPKDTDTYTVEIVK